MSALMKTRPTNAVEIIILGRKPSRFVGPKSGLENIVASLSENRFMQVDVGEGKTIPWEVLAGSRIEKFGKPGLALRGARIKEGLTQEQLGKKLGVSQYNISKMEKGSRAIGKNMAIRISKILNMNYKVFL